MANQNVAAKTAMNVPDAPVDACLHAPLVVLLVVLSDEQTSGMLSQKIEKDSSPVLKKMYPSSKSTRLVQLINNLTVRLYNAASKLGDHT